MARSARSARMPAPAQPDRPGRPERAGLAYLALGDWHGRKALGDRCWYSGTPEMDDFGIVDGGQALLVELPARTPRPRSRRLPPGASTGARSASRSTARTISRSCRRGCGACTGNPPPCSSICASRARCRSPVASDSRAPWTISAPRCGSCGSTTARSISSPSAEDLEAIAHGGFVRIAAEKLRAMAEDPDAPGREVAARALLRLYVEHRKLRRDEASCARARAVPQVRPAGPGRRHGRWPEPDRRPQRDGQVHAVRRAAGGAVRAPPLAGPDGQELSAGGPRGRVAPGRLELRDRRPALSDREALPAAAERRAHAARRPPPARRAGRGGARRPARPAPRRGSGRRACPKRSGSGACCGSARASPSCCPRWRRRRAAPCRRPRRRARRGARRRSGRGSDQDDRAGAARAGLQGRAPARPLQGGRRRAPGPQSELADLEAETRGARARSERARRRPGRARAPAGRSERRRERGGARRAHGAARPAHGAACGDPRGGGRPQGEARRARPCAGRADPSSDLREALAAAEAARQAAIAAETAAVTARPQPSVWPRSRPPRWSACRRPSIRPESHRRGLQRLVQAIRQRDDAGAALRAAASEVALELEPGALERVRVGGRPLGPASRALRIVDPLEIEIAEVGRIPVRPVVPDRRRLQASLRDAERRIADELESARAAAAERQGAPAGVRARDRRGAARRRRGGVGHRRDAPSWPEAATR